MHQNIDKAYKAIIDASPAYSSHALQPMEEQVTPTTNSISS